MGNKTAGAFSGIPAEENSMQNYQDKQKNRQIINARSLSLEVTKHKHRLAAQLVCKRELFFCFCSRSLLFRLMIANQHNVSSHKLYSAKQRPQNKSQNKSR